MSSVQEKIKTGGLKSAATLIEEMKRLGEFQGLPGTRKVINSELWHACAGPLVSLPQPGSLVYYYPQGHSEQVTASTRRKTNSHIPNYPSLPSQMMCQVHNVTLHADKDTDEIYAQMTLQPVNSENDVFSIPNFGLAKSKQPNEFFCKTLTASDTSTHGGFSVPRRAAEKLFPQLDFSMQPPNQELVVRDLHDNTWTFRHIYRGQPKRHLLTTGWSVFVGAKRLKAGDSVLFIRDEKAQLLLGVRRVNRQQTVLPSSVLSADSMHMGVLAAAAHAVANHSPFTIYYNPRACPSEFVVPLTKYHKAAYGTQISVGMRFGMMFEAEDSSKRRFMGTIVGVSDCDPLRWPNSKWRSLQVEWDEHGCVERPDRVSLWEIESPESLFVFAAPTLNLKRQYHPGVVGGETGWENMIKRPLSRASENGNGDLTYPIVPGLDSEQLMKALLEPHSLGSSIQVGCHQSIYASILQNIQSHESPVAPSTAPACLAQPEAITETRKHQNYQFPFVQKQVLPLQHIVGQNQNPQHCLEQQQPADSDFATHILKEQIAKMSPSKKKDQVQNELDEHKSDLSRSQFENVSLHQRDIKIPDITSARYTDQLDKHPQNYMSSTVQQLHAERQIQFPRKYSEANMAAPLNPENFVTQIFQNQGPALMLQGDVLYMQQQLNTTQLPQPETAPLMDTSNLNSLLHLGHHSSQSLDSAGWMSNPSCHQSFTSTLKSGFLSISGKPNTLLCASENTTSSDISAVVNLETCTAIERVQFPCISESTGVQCLPLSGQAVLGTHQPTLPSNPPQVQWHVPDLLEEHSLAVLSSEFHDISVPREVTATHGTSGSCELRDFSEESNNQSETYSNLHFDASNGRMIVGPSVLSIEVEGFGTERSSTLHIPSEAPVGNFSSCQDVQSQVTSASLADSHAFSVQEFPDSSGGTSSSNLDFNESSFLNKASWKQVSPPLRTYTKIQKLGSVGRSIDISRFRNYSELKSAIACMFGLEGQLDNPRGSGWKLVYVDYENDVLLVGDDPWEEFVGCVHCIRILSTSEVEQMSDEGLHLRNSAVAPQVNKSSFLEDGHAWDYQRL